MDRDKETVFVYWLCSPRRSFHRGRISRRQAPAQVLDARLNLPGLPAPAQLPDARLYLLLGHAALHLLRLHGGMPQAIALPLPNGLLLLRDAVGIEDMTWRRDERKVDPGLGTEDQIKKCHAYDAIRNVYTLCS